MAGQQRLIAVFCDKRRLAEDFIRCSRLVSIKADGTLVKPYIVTDVAELRGLRIDTVFVVGSVWLENKQILLYCKAYGIPVVTIQDWVF